LACPTFVQLSAEQILKKVCQKGLKYSDLGVKTIRFCNKKSRSFFDHGVFLPTFSTNMLTDKYGQAKQSED
jgi:hypothetical protein